MRNAATRFHTWADTRRLISQVACPCPPGLPSAPRAPPQPGALRRGGGTSVWGHRCVAGTPSHQNRRPQTRHVFAWVACECPLRGIWCGEAAHDVANACTHIAEPTPTSGHREHRARAFGAASGEGDVATPAVAEGARAGGIHLGASREPPDWRARGGHEHGRDCPGPHVAPRLTVLQGGTGGVGLGGVLRYALWRG